MSLRRLVTFILPEPLHVLDDLSGDRLHQRPQDHLLVGLALDPNGPQRLGEVLRDDGGGVNGDIERDSTDRTVQFSEPPMDPVRYGALLYLPRCPHVPERAGPGCDPDRLDDVVEDFDFGIVGSLSGAVALL